MGAQTVYSTTEEKRAYSKKHSKEYYVENKEKVLARQKEERKVYPERYKLRQQKQMLWLKYRITPEEQHAIEEFQAQHPKFKLLLGNKMGTDHNHKTGLIRGRLEWRLNRAYGLIEKVSPNNTAEVLRALATFHENPPATIALGEKRFGLIGVAKYKKRMVYGSENGPLPAEKKRKRK